MTDNGFDVGDVVNSATVAVHLTDSGGSEAYTFTIGVGQTFSSVNVPGGGGSTDIVTFTVPSIADLQADGKITIEVRSTSGDFTFADSTLVAQITEVNGVVG